MRPRPPVNPPRGGDAIALVQPTLGRSLMVRRLEDVGIPGPVARKLLETGLVRSMSDLAGIDMDKLSQTKGMGTKTVKMIERARKILQLQDE